MLNKCIVTQEPLKVCKRKDCMYSSCIAETGCMVADGWDPSNMLMHQLASHKGITQKEGERVQYQAIADITICLKILRLFEWYATLPQEYTSVLQDMTQFPYNVKDLRWTPARIALTRNKELLAQFNKKVGSNTDWATIFN